MTSSPYDVIYQNPNYANHEKVTIYCVHGTADRSSAFTLIAERLLDKLPNVVASIHLVSFKNRGKGKGIEVFAKQLQEKIRANKDQDIILMGHSRGGLVVSYFAEYFAAEIHANVHGVVAICSPFGGSDLAIAPLSWLSDSVKQMESESEFLNNLRKDITHSNINYYFVAAEKDSLVSMDQSFVKKDSASLTIFDRHGHLSIMSSWRLVEHIQRCVHRMLITPSKKELDEMKSTEIENQWTVVNVAPTENEIKELELEEEGSWMVASNPSRDS
ncbi:MAG: alpha/beta hydrolase [Gammaproteobacteria bacterium]|nr:alpha/beta hydrolase [Gammaproteobacteria bacterium]